MKKGWLVWLAVPALLLGCSQSNDYDTTTLDRTSLEMRAGDVQTVYVTSGNPDKVVWRSANEFVATVDRGQIKALRIGSTRVWANSAAVAVTVKGRYDLYDEPMTGLRWGMTREELVAKLGFPDGVVGNVLIYNMESATTSFLSYEFDADMRLTGASVSVSKGFSDELEAFLGERYLQITSEGRPDQQYIDALTVTDASVVVTRASYDDLYWLVTYRDITSYAWQ